LLVAFVLVAGVHDVTSPITSLAKIRGDGLVWVSRALYAASWGIGAVTALRLASRLREDTGLGGAAPAGGSISGAPLRLLAWSILARIGIAILGQVAFVVSASSGDYGSIGAVMMATSALSAFCAFGIAAGLVGYSKMPESHRSGGAIVFAMLALGVGTLADSYGALAADELFEMLDEMKRATSFWAMPSLSKMEALQTTLRVAAVFAMALGVGASLGLGSSLRRTATAIGRRDLEARGGRVVVLLVITGLAALALGLMLGNVRESGLVLMLGVVVLVLGVTLLVSRVGLLFNLADALDGRGASD
jgi:hypothetical protein